MKCQSHPRDSAIGACVECGVGVCDRCQVTVQRRIYCRSCVESVLSSHLESHQLAEEIRLRDPASAAAMSMLHTGLGQLYNGDIGKGIMLIVSNLSALLLGILVAFSIHWLMGVLLLLVAWGGLTAYGTWDAYLCAARFNERTGRGGGIQTDGISEFSPRLNR